MILRIRFIIPELLIENCEHGELNRVECCNMKLIDKFNKGIVVPVKNEELLKLGQYYPKNIATTVVMSKAKLNGTQYAVYDFISCLYNVEKLFAYPSYEFIAKHLGINNRTVKSAVKRLEELGFLIKTKCKDRNGGDTSNNYVPYCIKLDFRDINQELIYFEKPPEIKKVEVNTCSQGECSNDHPGDGEISTQLKENIKELNKKKSTNESEIPKEFKNNVDFSLPYFPGPFIPHLQNIPGMSIAQSAPLNSDYSKTNNDHKTLTENYQRKSIRENLIGYQKDGIYFNSSRHIQRIYDVIVKINDDFGFNTNSWRMNEKDLNNIEHACEEEKVEDIIRHIIAMGSKLKNPEKPLGISYFLKKYKNQWDHLNCGRLV